ncbi:MAG: class IV adenylate cyclase [Phycisphaerales bacterium]
MKNVEFKAELRDPALARAIAGTLGGRPVGMLDQTDTYFRVGRGRLKRRETVGEDTEWIQYLRPDASGARVSEYTVCGEEEALERFGASPMPVWVVVRKRRELLLIGNVRVHLDEVEGLGWFLEFEAMVRPGNPMERCEARVRQLRGEFGPALGEPISVGYADLVAALD